MEAVVKKKTWLLGWRDWQWEKIKRKYIYHKIIAWSNSHRQEHPEEGAAGMSIWDCRLWGCPRQHLRPNNRDKSCQGVVKLGHWEADVVHHWFSYLCESQADITAWVCPVASFTLGASLIHRIVFFSPSLLWLSAKLLSQSSVVSWAHCESTHTRSGYSSSKCLSIETMLAGITSPF